MKRFIFVIILAITSSSLFAAKSCKDLGLQNYSSTFVVNTEWNNFRNSHPNLGLYQLKSQFSQQVCPTYLSKFHPPIYKSRTCLFMAPNSPGPIFHADNNHPAKIKIVGCKIKTIKADILIKKAKLHNPLHGDNLGNPAPKGKPSN